MFLKIDALFEELERPAVGKEIQVPVSSRLKKPVCCASDEAFVTVQPKILNIYTL